MCTGEALVVVRTVDRDMPLDILAELLTDLVEIVFLARLAHHAVAEIGVHARAVPVRVAQGLRMPIDGQAVFLGGALEQVAGHPGLVTGALGPLGENLEFPLAGGHLGVDALDIDARLEAGIEMLLDDFAPVGVAATHRAIVRALGSRKAVLGESRRAIRLGHPQEILLLEAEPEIVVVILDRGAAVGLMGRAIGVQHLGHHEV